MIHFGVYIQLYVQVLEIITDVIVCLSSSIIQLELTSLNLMGCRFQPDTAKFFTVFVSTPALILNQITLMLMSSAARLSITSDTYSQFSLNDSFADVILWFNLKSKCVVTHKLLKKR